jgi:predicted negative regulator of RcsB-dependent stress response
MLFEAKAYDEALQQLTAPMPSDFNALAADRRGDILLAQGKKAEAKAQYEAAYKGLDERSDYRRIIEVKLNALGVDPVVKVAAPAAAVSETAK